MRSRWLLVPLVVSLAVNAGVLVSLGVSYARDRKAENEWSRSLRRGRRSIVQVDSLMRGYAAMREQRHQRLLLRQSLGELALVEADSTRIDSVLTLIARVDRIELRAAMEWLVRWRELRRLDIVAALRRRTEANYDSLLQVGTAGGRVR